MCMYVCTCIYMYVGPMYVHVCIIYVRRAYTCMYVYVCIYVCMYNLCMYTCVCIHVCIHV